MALKKKPAKSKRPPEVPGEAADWHDDVEAFVVAIKGKQGRMHAVYARTSEEDIFLGSFMRQDTLRYVLNALDKTYGLPIVKE